MARTAYEVSIETRTELAGHKDVDTERFDRLRDDIDELKGDVRALDAKQAGYHRDNTVAMGKLEGAVQAMNIQIATSQGQRDGVRLMGMTIKDWLLVLLSVGTLVIAGFKAAHGG